MKNVFITLIFVMVPPLAHSQLDVESLIVEGAVKVFETGCLKYYPRPVEFEDWVRGNKLEFVPGFAKTPKGKAYSVNNSGVRYLLVAEDNNLCTVFVKDAHFEKAKVAVGLLLKKIEERTARFTATTQNKELPLGGVDTTHYDYYNSDEKVVLRIVVSQSQSDTGFFQLAMSATSKLWEKNRGEE